MNQSTRFKVKMIGIQARIGAIMSQHTLLLIVVAGLLIRIILMPITAHPYDVYAWYTLSMDSLKNPTVYVYNFPPLWYNYMMLPIAHAYSLLSQVFPTGTIPMASLPSALNFYPSMGVDYVPGMLFNTIVKIPFLLSDILLTLLLYKTLMEFTKNKGLAEKASLLWFLNPFVIWISAGWGMWDTMPALFSLASFYLIQKKRITLSAISLSLGVASKLYPALFIVPIAFYILKSKSYDEKYKSSLKYFLAFLVTSTLLFLPYFGIISSFFSSYFMTNPASSTLDSVTNPLGFGLTYWSLYSLNRLVNLPISAELVTIVSVGSIMLVFVSLMLVYWRISKITFNKQPFDLALVMVLPVLALLLSYRIIPEQWFIWALPFLIVLYVGKQVKGIYFWGASFIALLYAILNCPLPFFFLPLAPWHTNTLLGMVHAFWEIDFHRILLLAILGLAFSIIIIIILLRLLRCQSPNGKEVTQTPKKGLIRSHTYILSRHTRRTLKEKAMVKKAWKVDFTSVSLSSTQFYEHRLIHEHTLFFRKLHALDRNSVHQVIAITIS